MRSDSAAGELMEMDAGYGDEDGKDGEKRQKDK